VLAHLDGLPVERELRHAILHHLRSNPRHASRVCFVLQGTAGSARGRCDGERGTG
jgi:hypothetical protein